MSIVWPHGAKDGMSAGGVMGAWLGEPDEEWDCDNVESYVGHSGVK